MPMIGPYRVVAELGRGAFGLVVEAIDDRTGRHYAIKTLLAHATTLSQRGLLDEAAAVVQLSHPNIVALVDVGRDEDGALFLVMELVRGPTLRAWRQQWPGTAAVFGAFDEMLDALSTAHAQGIVHGDLKPANVLLERSQTVKMTDFGIARVIDPLRGRKDRTTGGTPLYMAPEQLFDPEDVGPPADLYAIGVMLRQLLGRREQEPDATPAEMITSKLSRPSAFVLRDDLWAPPELGALVNALTDPDPRMRPRFAAHVRRDLANIAPRAWGRSRAMPEHAKADLTLRDATYATSSPAGRALSDGTFDDAPAPEVLVRRLRPVPLVARRREMDLLASLQRDVSEGGSPRALVIMGRAGDGKSRLARHGFADVERTGTMVGAAASFDESGQSASVDLRACLRRLLGAPRAGSAPDQTLRDRWAWLRPWLTEKDVRELHRFLVPGAFQLDTDEAAALATTALTAVAHVRPVYLWLDDVAWSRDGALPLVERLLGTDARVLVVATVRSGTAEHPATRGWLERVGAHPRATVHALEPLSPDERIRLLMTVGPIVQRDAAELAPLLDQSTLVILEAVREWIDQGLLVRRSDDTYVKRPDVPAVTFAQRASGALARRLDALLSSFGDDNDRAERTLIHAALLGVHFEERALRESCDGPIDDILDRTLLVGVLRVHGTGIYRFEHQLFAQAVLDRLARRSDQADLRLRSARAIVSTYGLMRPEITMIGAHLFRAAGDLESAYDTAVDAASNLAGSGAVVQADEVIAVIERWALADAADPDAPPFAQLYRARGNKLLSVLAYPEALENLVRARAIFTRAGRIDVADRLALRVASAHFFSDQLWQAREVLRDVTPRATTPRIASRLHHHMAELLQLQGDLDGALASQRAACMAAADDIAVVHTLAALLFLHGDLDEAEDARRRVVDWFAHSTLASAVDQTTSLLILSLCVRGQVDRALPHARAWLASTRARDNRWQMSSACAFVAAGVAATGTDEEAESTTRAAMAAYHERPHDELQTWWAIRAAESWLRQRGMASLADAYGAMLNDRQQTIVQAFTTSA